MTGEAFKGQAGQAEQAEQAAGQAGLAGQTSPATGDASRDEREGLKAKDIVCLGHLKRVFPLLDKLRDVGCERDTAGNRRLFFDDYCKLVLLYTWNPLLASVRDLQKAVGLKRVAETLGVGRFSLGSFSESVRVFEPDLLKGVIDELAKEVGAQRPALRSLPGDPRLKDLEDALTLSDGTVLAALPRLAKAASEGTRYVTARDGKGRYGWRLHTQLDLKTFCPRRIERTGASTADGADEANVLLKSVEAGRCYVMDGAHARRQLLQGIAKAGSNFVCRMRTDNVFQVTEGRPLSKEALAAGVVRDELVTWGDGPPMRVVRFQVEPHLARGGRGKVTDELVVGTDLLDLSADLVGLIYRQRYSVELFFRQLKQLLGVRHLLSQREEGLDIQVYCAVIVCLLINLITGKKPDRGTVLMVGFHMMGLATEQELLDYLNKPDNTGAKKRAEDELWKKLGY